MNEIVELLSQYIPEITSTSLGAIAIGAVIYCIKYITKRLETFRSDPAVAQLKEDYKQLKEFNKQLIADNKELRDSLQRLSDDVHHIYRGK